MKIACYIGSHKKDRLSVRLGWALVRFVQRGHFCNVTHVEAILAEYDDGTVDIGSSSLRDGGVRIKYRVHLNPENWLIIDVPVFNTSRAVRWFNKHNGEKYDTLGAVASALPFRLNSANKWFCNEAVGAAAGLNSPEIFGPAQFASVCATLGNLVFPKKEVKFSRSGVIWSTQ